MARRIPRIFVPAVLMLAFGAGCSDSKNSGAKLLDRVDAAYRQIPGVVVKDGEHRTRVVLRDGVVVGTFSEDVLADLRLESGSYTYSERRRCWEVSGYPPALLIAVGERFLHDGRMHPRAPRRVEGHLLLPIDFKEPPREDVTGEKESGLIGHYVLRVDGTTYLVSGVSYEAGAPDFGPLGSALTITNLAKAPKLPAPRPVCR
jgi:hypothetical protein